MNATATRRRRRRSAKEVHHGRTPAAWAGSMLALLGFVVLCAAMVFGPDGIPSINVPLAVVGGAILVLAPLVGGIMNRAGLGQD